MEANNFKLFELIDETIRDIYDFFIRYFKTMWLLFTSPKKLNEICETEYPFKQVIRPFNFILVSFILFGFAIDILSTESVTDFFSNAEGKQSETLQSLIELDSTYLVIKFLPFIVLFIIISKGVEVILNLLFKSKKPLSTIYLYGIGYSCSLFFFTILSVYLYTEFVVDKTGEMLNIVMIFLAIFFLLYQIIYPSFLMSRSLKYLEVKLWKRAINFISFLIVTILLVTGFIKLVTVLDEFNNPTYDEFGNFVPDITFQVFNTEKTSSGVKLTMLYDSNDILIAQQHATHSVIAESYNDTLYLSFQGEFTNVDTEGNLALLKPNQLFVLNLDLDPYYTPDYSYFDSLYYYTGSFFHGTVTLNNAKNEGKVLGYTFR